MSFLETLIGTVTNQGRGEDAEAGSSSPVQAVLRDLLAGGTATPGGQPASTGVGGALGGMLAGAGGLPGLVQKFEQAGLGDKVQSWLGDGSNQPVSTDEVGSALGHGTVQEMAARYGIDTNVLLGQLSQHLPELIDRLTTGGSRG